MIDLLELDLLGEKNRPAYEAARTRAREKNILAIFEDLYPNGLEDWVLENNDLNARGDQMLVDKINEIIAHINKPA